MVHACRAEGVQFPVSGQRYKREAGESHESNSSGRCKESREKGEIVEASDAYARNVLLRQKLAVEATGKARNDLKLQKANDEKVAAENLAEAEALKKKIEASSVTLKVKTGEGGRLFGSVSSKEISEAIQQQIGVEVDRKKIVVENPIKNVGQMEVLIKLHTKVRANLKVKVESL